ncbi:MAG: hypothetical protein JXA67_01310, partial [Micromonosporaceae bacterium]|nr:hypothetical protein [Micromonosporaceae bacterium]
MTVGEESGAAGAAFEAFEAAALAAVARLGPAHVRALAARVAGGWPDLAALQTGAVPGFAEAVAAVLAAQRAAGLPDGEA